jgi:teichuronic acid biosynthesis glycosyltransferase TuaC
MPKKFSTWHSQRVTRRRKFLSRRQAVLPSSVVDNRARVVHPESGTPALQDGARSSRCRTVSAGLVQGIAVIGFVSNQPVRISGNRACEHTTIQAGELPAEKTPLKSVAGTPATRCLDAAMPKSSGMTMRKITAVTWYFPVREELYRGHSAYQTLRRLKGLVEVDVLCPQPRYPRFIGPRSYRNSRTDLTYSVPDLPVRYIPYPAFPVVSRPFNGFICARIVEPYLRASAPDVIFSWKIYPEGYAAVILGEKLGIPVVLNAIGSDLNAIPDPVSKALTSSALRRATLVLAVSEHLAQRAVELGAPADRTRAILNGCDTAIFCCQDRNIARRELGIPLEAAVLLFVGRLDPLKGVRELMQAFAVLAAEIAGLRLVFIGEGPARQMMASMSLRSGMTDRISFVEPCSSARVARWMTAADVFAFPSYAEGCPNAIVEALHCGRPVVATTVGGIPELVGPQDGILVSPREVVPLTEALRTALSTNWDLCTIAKRVNRSWDRVAQDVFEACRLAADLHAHKTATAH